MIDKASAKQIAKKILDDALRERLFADYADRSEYYPDFETYLKKMEKRIRKVLMRSLAVKV